jgi:hypothetical protein
VFLHAPGIGLRSVEGLIMKTQHGRSRASRRYGALALLSLLFVLFATRALAAVETFREWEARMAAFYEANPELKGEKGSGWKPYNRFKYFMEQRMQGAEEIPAGARWNAFLRKRELERSRPKAAVASWFSLGPENFAGRILDVKFDPNNVNVIYLGSASGGIWRSTNGGLAWTALEDELPTLAVGAIGLFPSNSNRILIGTGEPTFNGDRVSGVGVLKSTDGGSTWSTTRLSYAAGTGHGFNSIEVNPTNEVVLAAATDGIWRSTDQGDTWTQIGSSGNYTDVKWKPGSVDTAYAVRSGGWDPASAVLRSVDGGLSFTSISTGLPPATEMGRTRLGVTGGNPAYLYANISNQQTGETHGLYRSTDGGDSWSLRSTTNLLGSQGWYDNMIILYPENPERLFIGGIQLYRSVDGGVTFAQVGGAVLHVDHHAAAYRPGTNNNLFVGCDGGVWESTNRGVDWIDRNAGLVTYQFYDICVSQPDPLRAWGGTQDNGTDGWVNSTTWLDGLGADGMVCNGHPVDALTVYGEHQQGVHFKSTNGGFGWFSINNGIAGGGNWVTPVDLDPRNGDHLFTASSAGVYRSTDGGANWVNVDATQQPIWISISPADSQVVWTAGWNFGRYSTDDGQTWNSTNAPGFPVGNLTKILAHPLDRSTALATFSSYASVARVIRTTDFGATWQNVSGNLPLLPVNAIAVDPQDAARWYIGTDVGVWATANEGQTWVPFETGLPNVVVTDLEIQNATRKLRAGTYGRGLWEIDLTAVTTVGPGAPAGAIDLMLDPPYPNPVKGETILRYAARRDGETLRLAVFDVQGRLVTRLAEHAADGIIRQIRWAPEGAASGVYFVMLRVGADQKTQKIVLVQ